MNKSRLDFIEIGSYDEEELAKLGSLPFRNVSVELDALAMLALFSLCRESNSASW